MFGTIRIAALSALIGLGTLAGMPASAQADGFYFSFGNGGPHAGIHFGKGGHRYYHRHYRRHYSVRACTPWRAVRKARRMGIHRAHVVWANHHVIKVSGRKHHRYVRVTFARAPHCPVIRYR